MNKILGKKNFLKCLPIIFTIFSLIYVFNSLEINIFEISFNSKLELLLTISIGLLLVSLQNFFVAKRWFLISKYFGGKNSFKNLFFVISYSYFLNQFLPASIAGDAYRSYSQKSSGTSYYKGISTVLIDRIIGLISMCLMSCIFVLFLPIGQNYNYISILSLATFGFLFFYPKINLLKN